MLGGCLSLLRRQAEQRSDQEPEGSLHGWDGPACQVQACITATHNSPPCCTAAVAHSAQASTPPPPALPCLALSEVTFMGHWACHPQLGPLRRHAPSVVKVMLPM